MARSFSQGFFTPRYPEKYKGNINKIIYRSSWEFDFCRFLDNNPNILEWASEPFAIPYIKPTDKKIHRYYPDFWIKYIDVDKKIIEEVIEVKPIEQTKQPTTRGKKKKTQIYEAITYAVNIAKWKAAQEFCAKYNMNFRKISKGEIFR